MDRRTFAALFLLVGCLAVGLLIVPAAGSHGEDDTDVTVSPDDRNPDASGVSHELELEWTAGATDEQTETEGAGDPDGDRPAGPAEVEGLGQNPLAVVDVVSIAPAGLWARRL